MNKLKLLITIPLIILLINTQKVFAAPTSNRIAGNDRYETAVQISKSGWVNKSKYAILATGEDFPDALCAAPLAKKYDAPILLNTKNTLLPNVREEIKRLGVEQIIIVGGSGAISDNVENELTTMNINCTRIYGKDRYDTAIKVAEQLDVNSEIAIATGENFPDAISISSIAAERGMPILLTQKSYLPDTVAKYLQNKSIKTTYIIGGNDVVNDEVANKFQNVERLQGSDRYDTNIAVINKFSNELKFNSFYVATGNDYPDALAASVLAAKNNSPVCLVSDSSVDRLKNIIAPKLQDSTNILAIGESDVVSEDVVEELSQKNGNTNSNLANGSGGIGGIGFVARQGAWDYYYMVGSPYHDVLGNICKVKKDGTKSYILNTDAIVDGKLNTKSNINVVGEWIYYENIINTTKGEESYKYTEGIYKLKNDGSSNIKICSDDAEEIIVSGEWIYYINASDKYNIYKIKIDGSEKTKITNYRCNSINISGDSIYYLKFIDVNSPYELYKIKTDVTNETRIPCNDEINFLVTEGDYIYYLNSPSVGSERTIFRMKLDGTEKTKLCDVTASILSYNVSGGSIYYKYLFKNNSFNLYKLSNDGKVQNFPMGESVQSQWIVDNQIYFYTDDGYGNVSYYRMNNDGTNLQIINKVEHKS